MPLFMENRFKVVIILVVFLSLIYGAEALMLSASDDISSYGLDNPDYNEEDVHGVNTSGTSAQNVGGNQDDILGAIGGLFSFLAFTIVDMPAWAFYPIALMISVVWFSLVFISVSIIYDFIKALPLT